MAHAEDAGQRVPSAIESETNSKHAVGLVDADVPSGLNGPFASFTAPLAERGVTFHALFLDFSAANPSLGLSRGRGANTAFIIEGFNLDLEKIAGLRGLSLHFDNAFFGAVANLGIAGQIGDSQVGYQPPPTPRSARLTRATVEQTLLSDRLGLEAGITHPNQYYALANCSSINSCYQDLFYINGGFTTPFFSVPAANVSFRFTPATYVEAGAFAVQPNANNFTGYDLGQERFSGVLAMTEIGIKKDFDTAVYPSRLSLTGFANNADHVDFDRATAVTGTSRMVKGTSGIVVQAEKVVWRRDGGLEPGNPAPTALKLYGSLGKATDSSVPIDVDGWIGVNLMSPFAGRPADRYGLKFTYERLNANYGSYLSAANLVAGGTGVPYARDKYILEANAHIELPQGTAVEPVVQYAINPNSYFNPNTPVRARNGLYLGGTYIVPVGVILGIERKDEK